LEYQERYGRTTLRCILAETARWMEQIFGNLKIGILKWTCENSVQMYLSNTEYEIERWMEPDQDHV
jgi:hypothetical protein